MSNFGISFWDLRVANAKRRKVWHTDNTEEWKLVDWSNELAEEVGEVCGVVKKLRRIETGVTKRGPRSNEQLLQALKEELGDVVIVADMIATEVGISLGDAVQMKFNMTTDKHELGVTLGE